jgi:chromosome segregation ATPase
MSTAGKILTVLVMLTLLGWIILAAGVGQYNTNGNTKLHELSQQVGKLEVDLQQTQDEILSQRLLTDTIQEDMDRNATLLRARQVELENASSQISDTLSSVRYQVATLQETIKGAETALQHRNTEHKALTGELTKMRTDVKDLIAECTRLRDRLASLRKDFQNTYHSNIEMVSKAGRSDNVRRGGTN